MMAPRTRGIIGGLSLLLLGAVLGIAGDRLLSGHHPRPGLTGEDGAERIHEKTMAHLRNELDLDDEQVDRIHRAFLEHQSTVDSSWRTLRPHLLSAIDSVHAEIEATLRPDQRERFRTWLEGQAALILHGGGHAPDHPDPGTP